ncbi:OsmC family protein [Joostella atrarenae]|uniref:OsmC family protein n=1 Tax=Joostella atrarenae TaxID=679257 RepID=A0ABS9J229_9FLAO|nr:OsmC family protein [Joostella atrarenae]MCF8714470.1 OsmC family protein [Joostella atrarenae]
MNYKVTASSSSKNNASIEIKESNLLFGTIPAAESTLPNPAELFLGSFSACVLKNVERFSTMMKFNYDKAEITVEAIRLEKPPRMDEINYNLKVYSDDENLNIDLLKKNIEKFGTMYNTVKSTCSVTGQVIKVPE